MTNTIYLNLFTRKYYNNLWHFYLQGPGTKHCMKEYNAVFPHPYPDIKITLTLYLALRISMSEGLDYIDKVTALVDSARNPPYAFAFTRNVSNFPIWTRNP
jgi:hypothetical protein